MTSINALPAQSVARRPRGLVKVNDTIVQGWVEWSVENNSFYQADTFRISFAASLLVAPFDIAGFSTMTEGFVEIFAGFPDDPANYTDGDLQSLIYGRIDDIEWSPDRTRLVLTGRDLTAALIDTKLTDQWNNLKSSDIATLLANKHGLTPQVTATEEIVGKYYQIDHVRLLSQRSEWDMITWLASQEGYVVYAKGHTLYFGPDPRSSDNPYVIQWQPPTGDIGYAVSNVQNLTFSRSLTVAKGITVVVHSWNHKQKKGFDAFYPSKAKTIQAGKASPFGRVQTYEFNFPSLTQEAATARAMDLYNEIIRHEVKLRGSLPGDNLLTPQVMIQTTGFEGNFNQMFYVDAVTREFSLDEGYSMSIQAKNHNPDLQVATS